jgi:hypothetical protein
VWQVKSGIRQALMLVSCHDGGALIFLIGRTGEQMAAARLSLHPIWMTTQQIDL